jgi:hypothetical protein
MRRDGFMKTLTCIFASTEEATLGIATRIDIQQQKEKE